MEPASNNQSNFELPPPQAQGEAAAVEQAPTPSYEAPRGNSEGPGSVQPTQDPYAVQSVAVAPSAPVAAPPAARQVSSNAPAAAEDVDLIEKEWVQKAKAIIDKTRTDPHTQNHEINKFKADYMKKRYDKDIKVTE